MLCSDNIIYYSYVAFETYKDLAEHLKQDATKKFIKCAALHPPLCITVSAFTAPELWHGTLMPIKFACTFTYICAMKTCAYALFHATSIWMPPCLTVRVGCTLAQCCLLVLIVSWVV